MFQSLRFLLACTLILLCTACASDGTFTNPFVHTAPDPNGSPYYFSEFGDVPIPNEMNESKSETFITFAPSGVKCGVQRFTGRVDVVSLMNTMRANMASNGWTLRSLLRAQESVLVFEKPDRIASLQISDGMVYTQMRLFMSSRLEGDSSSVEINPYTPKAAPAENL